MDFRQLNYICAVADHNSITKAAEALFISQPSLSHFISKTEEELGVALFDRSTSPISLTYAGECYVERARQILLLGKDLSKEMQDISGRVKGRLRVGMPRERSAYMVPAILSEFRARYPHVETEMIENNTRFLEEQLLSGKVDFMIVPFHVAKENLRFERIYEEELLLVAKRGLLPPDCFLEGGGVALERVEAPFIMLKRGHAIRSAVELLFEAYGAKPAIAMEIQSNMTACRLAAAGVGVAIVPSMTIKLTNLGEEVEAFSITPHPVTWEVGAVYRKGSYLGAVERAFLEIAKTQYDHA